MNAYKFLSAGSIGLFSDFHWPPPGEWVDAGDPVVDCLVGVHALQFEQLLDWIDDELWEIELDGAIVEHDGVLVAERGRLINRVEKWNATAAWAFADACALRSAGFAADALRRAGAPEAAACIDDTSELSSAQDAAVSALEETTDSRVTEVVSFAADMVSLVNGNRPDAWRLPKVTSQIAQSPGAIAANAGFVAAHAAGRAAFAETSDEGSYQSGFEAERAWQLAKLADLLR